MRHLYHNGVAALKAGELDSAKRYFERALYSARDIDLLADLWFYMSETESGEKEKRNALEEALSYQPTHARARRSLAILNGTLKPMKL
jgi:Tfp pilus assembly protein PilF